MPVTVLEPEGLELRRVEGYAEKELSKYPVDSRLQFVRYGFVRVDYVGGDGGYRVVLTHR